MRSLLFRKLPKKKTIPRSGDRGLEGQVFERFFFLEVSRAGRAEPRVQ